MRNRRAFTLVELMVAMALTIFIMVILTQAFVLSIDTFRGLKAIGDMQETLRAGTNSLRFDLKQNHFDAGRRASDPNFNATKPREGFLSVNTDGITINRVIFKKKKPSNEIVLNGAYSTILPGMLIVAPAVVQGSPQTFVVSAVANQPAQGETLVTMSQVALGAAPAAPVPVLFTFTEGLDQDGMPSTLSPFSTLHMSCRLKGNQQQSFYTTSLIDVPTGYNLPSFLSLPTFYNLAAGTVDADSTLRAAALQNSQFFRSQWAETFFFLGSGNSSDASPATTYGLFQQTGTTEEPSNPQSTLGMPLYSLYRAQYVTITDGTYVNSVTNTTVKPPAVGYPSANNSNYPMYPQGLYGNFAGFAAMTNLTKPKAPVVQFLTPNDLANGTRTLTPQQTLGNFHLNAARMFGWSTSALQSAGLNVMPNGSLVGPTATLLVPNVLSFQVQGIFAGSFPMDVFYDSTNPNNANWIQNLPPGSLLGVYITLRVWDNGTRQTRQISVYQDL